MTDILDLYGWNVTAKFGNTCRSCGGVYEDKDLLAARTNGPYFDDKPEDCSLNPEKKLLTK